MKSRIFLASTILMAVFFCPLRLSAQLQSWTLQLDKAGRQELSIELDHYYSCLYYTLGLTDEPIPKQKINTRAK
jgi:hypothetical protein